MPKGMSISVGTDLQEVIVYLDPATIILSKRKKKEYWSVTDTVVFEQYK